MNSWKRRLRKEYYHHALGSMTVRYGLRETRLRLSPMWRHDTKATNYLVPRKVGLIIEVIRTNYAR